MTCLAPAPTARPRTYAAPPQPARSARHPQRALRRVRCAATTMPHGDASDSDGEYSYDLHINPDTGNPQTGKVIDEYLWLVPLLAVIAIGFVSLGNVGDVLQQVGQADSIRAPADRYEWTNLDNQDVRAPDCAASLLSGRSKTDRLPVRSVGLHNSTLVLSECTCKAGCIRRDMKTAMRCRCMGPAAMRRALRVRCRTSWRGAPARRTSTAACRRARRWSTSRSSARRAGARV